MTELTHDLDLAAFAPLVPEQILDLIVALHRPELSSNPGSIAAYVNERCPAAPALDAAQVEQHAATAAARFTSPFHKYSLWAQVFPDPWFTFMNYGHDGPAREELIWPRAAAMYQHVASRIDLAGTDVLEVGCGRGGGAAYVARHLGPRSVVASDGTRSNVMFCRSVHTTRGLRFEHALAEDLPFADQTFDVVLNVESCKYYDPFAGFTGGVGRVLRPGGHLLLAFFAPPAGIALFRDAVSRAGLTLLAGEDLSEHVRAAVATSHRDLADTLARLPTVRDRRHYKEFFDSVFAIEPILSGRASYWCFDFQKPP